MNKPTLLTIFLVLAGAAGLSVDSHAAFVCYNEKYFPAVFSLWEVDKGVRAQLGGVYADAKQSVSPVLSWSEQEGWADIKTERCRPCTTNIHQSSCAVKIPQWEPSPPNEACLPGEDCRQGIPVIRFGPGESREKIEETPSCTIAGNVVYFGIDFYRGEGYTGYGGLGRYDLASKRLEVRRPPALTQVPIHKIIWDGENIWAATTTNYECIGHPPALGLIKYNWSTGTLTQFKGKKDGPCGFIIHDLLWSNGFLWVATDVGISRWSAKGDRWTHYLPDIASPRNVREGRCEAFYAELLDTLPKDEAWFGESRSYYQVFYDNLGRFRPDLIKLYESR